MKAGFDSLEVNDKLYKINWSENEQGYYTGKLYEVTIKSYSIVHSEQYDCSDRWEPEEIITRTCYKVVMKLSNGESLTVDLTNSDIYKYHFADYYVYQTEAENEIEKRYNSYITQCTKQISEATNKLQYYKNQLDTNEYTICTR